MGVECGKSEKVFCSLRGGLSEIFNDIFIERGAAFFERLQLKCEGAERR